MVQKKGIWLNLVQTNFKFLVTHRIFVIDGSGLKQALNLINHTLNTDI